LCFFVVLSGRAHSERERMKVTITDKNQLSGHNIRVYLSNFSGERSHCWESLPPSKRVNGLGIDIQLSRDLA
jgi:hypothetical protein